MHITHCLLCKLRSSWVATILIKPWKNIMCNNILINYWLVLVVTLMITFWKFNQSPFRDLRYVPTDEHGNTQTWAKTSLPFWLWWQATQNQEEPNCIIKLKVKLILNYLDLSHKLENFNIYILNPNNIFQII